MDKLDKLKKSIKRNKIILIICLVLILICGGCLAYSYAFKGVKKEEVTSTPSESYNEIKINDSKLLELAVKGAFYDMEGAASLFEIKEEKVEEVVPKSTVAKADNKEDPAKLAQANKGTAKKESASEAQQKYETNETSFGIDVSSWNGIIDWAAVKRSGVSFAMIRVGFRGYESGDILEDRYFRRNVQGAIANNINVGIYFFSAAKNSEEAREEAIWVANTIKNYDITYPVAIDIEIFDEHRLVGVSNSQMTTNALEFCKYISGKGYTPMIYSYLKAFNNIFETPRFGNYRVWLAQYNDVATYKGKYYMWQYTSDGSVPGITGRVDMNVAYFSVTNDITKRTEVTGTDGASSLETVQFNEAYEEVTINKTKELRASPYTNAPNRVGSIEAGEKVLLKGISTDFIKFEYNGNTLYIDDVNCFDLKEHTFSNDEKRVKTTKMTILFTSPHYILKNVVTINAGTEIDVLGSDDEYTKVKYNDNIYYVKGLDFYELVTESSEPEPTPEPEEPPSEGEDGGEEEVPTEPVVNEEE